MMSIARVLIAALAALASAWASGAERPAPTRTEIARDIYLFQTAPYSPVGLDGNAVVIVSPEGVLVFDSNGTPAAAAAVLEGIRAITSQPVRYVVNSHWHWDHWYGTEVYRDAFPDVQIVAHERTREMMSGPAIEFNRPGIESQLPGFISGLEQRIAEAEAASPRPETLPQMRQTLETARYFLDQKRGVRRVLPTLTYTDRLTVWLGSKEIQLHHARGVTPGDTFLYLPADRVLVSGDLLVNPISFALSCYPTSWLQALERIDAMDAAVIVPGHGAPLTDKSLLHATMEVFRALLRAGKEARAKGVAVDDARDAILPTLAAPMMTITGGAAALNDAFKVQLVDWYLHRVYEELDGPLSDAIAPIPPK